MNQKLAVGLLEKYGHAVDVVDDGRDALAAVESQALRPGPDGRPDAGNGRPGGDAGHPRTGERARRTRADRGHDRPRHERRPRALPGSGHGQLRRQADPRQGVVRDDCPSAPGIQVPTGRTSRCHPATPLGKEELP